jgi:uncharacterized protein
MLAGLNRPINRGTTNHEIATARREECTMSVTISSQAKNVNWLMSTFVDSTAGVDQAIAVSSDGLLMAMSANLDRANADKMGAITSGLRSLSDGASRVLNKGGLSQVIVEMGSAYMFVVAISGGSSLGVMAAKDCDLGQVGYEIMMLVDRMGPQLTPELISELKGSLGGL